jgi:hypothetical protein
VKPNPTVLLAALLLAGCAAVPPAGLDQGDLTLVVSPHVGDRGLLATIKPYVATDIHHLDVQLWNGATQVGNTKTLAGNPNGTSVTFLHLHKATDYTIKAFAYKSSDNSVKISVDATSSVNFTTKDIVNSGDESTPTIASVPVVLADQVFDGTATGAVSVTGGAVNDTAATESIL